MAPATDPDRGLTDTLPVEEVEVEGHIIDSLILPKILDCITAAGGNFQIARNGLRNRGIVRPSTFDEKKSWHTDWAGLGAALGRDYPTADRLSREQSFRQFPDRKFIPQPMARWPRHSWTSVVTYGSVFILFPLLALLAYAWVQGWIF